MQAWDASTPNKKAPLPEDFSFPKGKLSLLFITDSIGNPVDNTLVNGWDSSLVLTIRKNKAPQSNNFFFSGVSSSNIGQSGGKSYSFSPEKVKTYFLKPHVSDNSQKIMSGIGAVVGVGAYFFADILEAVAIGALIFSFDQAGSISNFSAFIKVTSIFRFINVFFGDHLELFFFFFFD